jgi:1-phosphofructokinase family hexose kinase
MIVSVTANTTLDQTFYVASFQKNTTMRATDSVTSMAGKPADASWVLSEIGITSLALGFAAGTFGKKIEAMLHARGISTDFVQVDGESRINAVIIDTGDHAHSTITTSTLDVSPEHIQDLYQRFERALNGASCVILGGTLPAAVPPSFYTDLIRVARARHVPTIFDAAEPNLSAGLAGGPTYAKPNRDELSALVGQPIDSLEAAYRAGREIFAKHGTALVITLGPDGALAVLPERAYHIPPVEAEVISPAGAGDAVLAGLAASVQRGQPIEEGLRLGIAAATAVLLMRGTAQCRREDIEHFLPQVKLIPYGG